MSTTINVTVGGNDLLDQSRQQMQANRFGRLEKDIDANDLRVAQAQHSALIPPQDSGMHQKKKSGPQPSANRVGGGAYLLLVPHQDFNSSTIILGKAKNRKYANWTDYTDWVNESPADLDPLTYLPTGGPAGSGALEHPGNDDPDLPSADPAFVRTWTYALQTITTDNGPIKGVNNTNQTVLVDDGSGGTQWIAPASSLKASALSSFTLEGYFRFGDNEPPPPVLANWYISLAAFIHDTSWNTPYKIAIEYDTYWLSRDPSNFDGSLYVGKGQPGGRVSSIININSLADTYLGITWNDWVHMAVVVSGAQASFYINGTRIAVATAASALIEGFDAALVSLSIELRSFNDGIARLPRPAFHGIRFTPKALYSTLSFTPPPSITSLA